MCSMFLALILHFVIAVMFTKGPVFSLKHVEEVSMKWIDRPIVTEMDNGGVFEMDRGTKCQTNFNATKMDKI